MKWIGIKVYSGDIMMGSVPDGKLVETGGYLWVSGGDMYLNVDPISARFPLIIDDNELPSATREKLRLECKSDNPSFSAGCEAVIHGTVGTLGGRRSIIASSIAAQHWRLDDHVK
jgi:hypothetical protein